MKIPYWLFFIPNVYAYFEFVTRLHPDSVSQNIAVCCVASMIELISAIINITSNI